MPIPAEVQSALDKVQADSDALEAAKSTAAEAQTNLDAAQTAATESSQAVVTAASKQATDLASLLTLLNETYGPGTARVVASSTMATRVASRR